MSRALVIGKFYPPHMGHISLIEYALTLRENVTVLIYGSPFDSFSVVERTKAIQDSLLDAEIDPLRVQIHAGYDSTPFGLENPMIWESHAYIFKTSMNLFGEVDLLVSAEEYGPELALRLGLLSKSFDLHRNNIPIRATSWRTNPVDNWEFLATGTRRALTTHVVFLGSESTGTTTTATAVTEQLKSRGHSWSHTNLVLEYGRVVTEEKLMSGPPQTLSVDWHSSDFAEIALRQSQLQAQSADGLSPVVICDTDAFATTIWERRYLGSNAQLDISNLRCGDIYLLTDHEGVPFVQDGTRDGEHIRAEMTSWFAHSLEQSQRPWVFLTGDLEERVQLALLAIDAAVKQRLTFNDPI